MYYKKIKFAIFKEFKFNISKKKKYRYGYSIYLTLLDMISNKTWETKKEAIDNAKISINKYLNCS